MRPDEFRLREVQFARSVDAVLPEAWGSPLRGFSSTMPYEEDQEIRMFGESEPVRTGAVMASMAVVADFVSDEGGLRLVVPEVRISSHGHGFAVRFLLSPELYEKKRFGS